VGGELSRVFRGLLSVAFRFIAVLRKRPNKATSETEATALQPLAVAFNK
jgi:hypothetical protein